MVARARNNVVPLGLSVLAMALAILQRPGWSSSDTKIDLHTAPVRFLGEIASLWTPSSGLGGVESAQYAGYLFPMGPFFALGHWLGISDWLVDRLWLGLLLAIGCWGMVRAAETLGAARTRSGAAVAGLVYLLNPYVVVFANRTTITLLAYALMPWMVLVARRGVRCGGRWREAALFALLVTAAGGGVNAAVVALVMLAPLVIVLYEPYTRAVPWRNAWSFGWRALVATFAASLWWIAPSAAQAASGADFLRFTEPAGAIWATTSLSESFRAMGYWISYIGVGFNGVVRPYFSDAGTLLFNHLVVTASLLVPGLALLGFAWTRRRRYAIYFLLLVLLGTLVMAIGFPEGTPLRRGATFAYNHFASVRFLRTTYKAGPLVVFGVAGLAALAVEALPARARVVGIAGACVLVALAAWPLTTGRAIDRQVSWKQIPAGWTAAAHDLDRTLGDNARAIVLPGQLYAFYNWGGTVDPILPALTKKPVAVRNAVPYGDLRGTDLLWTADALLQQGRLLPGQLQALLGLMSVREVIAASDDDVHRSGAVDPAASVAALARTPGLTARRAYGNGVRSFAADAARPLVRLERRAPAAVVDGSADGLAGLAAFGALPTRDPFSYAGDSSPAAVRAAVRTGATIAITDSNRRRIFVVSRLAQNTGWTLGASDPISQDAATLDPFADRGSDAQTVAVLDGARSITAPFSPGYSQFPEHRPFAAFDGDPRTAWLADPALDAGRHVVTVTFMKPLDVNAIDLLPRSEAGSRTVAVVVNGKRFDLGAGWTHLEVGLGRVRALAIKVIAKQTGSAAAGGLAEVRIPGLRITESLRTPVLAERALRGVDLSHNTVEYVFRRASGDNPLTRTDSAGVQVRRLVRDPAVLEHIRVNGAGDEEAGIDRTVDPPAARTYAVRAWLSATPDAADSALDALVGARGVVRADSSGRLRNQPRYRASSAFDADPSTAWIAPPDPAGASGASVAPAPWIRIRGPRAVTVARIGIEPPPPGFAAPSRVSISWPHGSTGALQVAGGHVVLPHPIWTNSLTVNVLAPSGGAHAVGIGELHVAGFTPLKVPRSGRIAGCSAAGVGSATTSIGMQVTSDIRDLDAGRPIAARGCTQMTLTAGPQQLRAPAATLRPDALLLSSPAPNPIARIATAVGKITSAGEPGRGRRDNVKLDVRAPAWLVLGESYDRGWRAWCGNHSLGAPTPLDGYANAWPVSPGCTTARFAFAAQRPVHLVQVLSALACLLLLGIALRGQGRTRARAGVRARRGQKLPRMEGQAPLSLQIEGPGPPVVVADSPDSASSTAFASSPDPAPVPMPFGRAAVAGLLAGAVLAFCFSLRSGALIAPGVALVLWRGVPAKSLALVGGLLLAVAVPLDYLVFPAADFGGYNPGYAGDQVGGHWIAVAAWVFLALAAWRTLSTASSRRRGAAGEAADASA